MCVTTIIGSGRSREYPRILQTCADSPLARLGDQNPEICWSFMSLITAFSHLPARQETSSERMAERNRDKEIP